jgi:hypothetical protein
MNIREEKWTLIFQCILVPTDKGFYRVALQLKMPIMDMFFGLICKEIVEQIYETLDALESRILYL